MTYILIALIAVGVALLIWAIRKRPVRIASPVLGVLNLAGEAGDSAIRSDVAGLESLLGPARRSGSTPPKCDVLLLYCEIRSTGEIARTSQVLRELVRDSGASIVVVGLDNSVQAYLAAVRSRDSGRTNLLMTLERRDPAFGPMLRRLFTKMKNGVLLGAAVESVTTQTGNGKAAVPVLFPIYETRPIRFV